MLAGSCWAFAATGALEAAVAIANQVAQPPDLAEEEIVDCVSSGCNGGNPIAALQYAQGASKGLAPENGYLYTAGSGGQSGTCKVSVQYT